MKAITFKLGSEDFCIDINYLKEIKPFNELKNTYVHNSPAMLKGLVNLRGSLIPVLDLGIPFNIENKGINVIMITLKDRIIGILVGPIGIIMEIEDGELEKVPSTIPQEEAKYISGIKRLEDKLLVHLKPESFLEISGERKGSERRGLPRRETDIAATYAIATGVGDLLFQPCRVLDVSPGGFKLFVQEDLNIGLNIKIKFKDGNEFDGTVIWSKSTKTMEEDGYCSGIKFEESPEIVESKIKLL